MRGADLRTAGGSHARVAFSIVKNNRKQWIGDRDDFLHSQVASPPATTRWLASPGALPSLALMLRSIAA
jgi:hypothetical protein